jgi:hypothetical protein
VVAVVDLMAVPVVPVLQGKETLVVLAQIMAQPQVTLVAVVGARVP